MSDKICPLMSCRTTSVSDPKAEHPTLTPTVARCMKKDCAWWDSQNAGCAVLSLVVEVIKIGDEL